MAENLLNNRLLFPWFHSDELDTVDCSYKKLNFCQFSCQNLPALIKIRDLVNSLTLLNAFSMEAKQVEIMRKFSATPKYGRISKMAKMWRVLDETDRKPVAVLNEYQLHNFLINKKTTD
ncbi:hypothetical protein HELRODRAFT_162232 [Helobdella robusta]|uniref:Uncharacterized protein n=1 Tax=Helobdella robusta TaxID=6412 RepID=T1ESE0_HELRO|nr:hypothetical protein HELRODRAFT_162232 [Helobdella robusta]ESN98776.1 hypothetical protein HELRODRAFT_162232 [Helobdella robusta]